MTKPKLNNPKNGAITKNQNVFQYVPYQLKRTFLYEVILAENFMDLLRSQGVINKKNGKKTILIIGWNHEIIFNIIITPTTNSLPLRIWPPVAW